MYWWIRVGMPYGTEVSIPDPTGGAIGPIDANDPIPATWRPSSSNRELPIWTLFIVCPMGIGLAIWSPANAAICARLGKVPADPPRWWVWWVRVVGAAVSVFGLIVGTLAYLPG
jgi:hypothetical protein